MPKPSLGSYLDSLDLSGKDVAVVGPNYFVSDDPSLLYFLNRATAKSGKGPESVTVIDAPPASESESHGNIHEHLADITSLRNKGIAAAEPEVIVKDVTKMRGPQRFDLLFDKETYKCIVNLKASKGNGRYAPPAKKVLAAYGSLLRPGGTAVFAYSDGCERAGYSVLWDLLEKMPERWEARREEGFFAERFQLREGLDREKIRRRGNRHELDDEGITGVGLDRDGYVTLGSGYGKMMIISATKL